MLQLQKSDQSQWLGYFSPKRVLNIGLPLLDEVPLLENGIASLDLYSWELES